MNFESSRCITDAESTGKVLYLTKWWWKSKMRWISFKSAFSFFNLSFQRNVSFRMPFSKNIFDLFALRAEYVFNKNIEYFWKYYMKDISFLTKHPLPPPNDFLTNCKTLNYFYRWEGEESLANLRNTLLKILQNSENVLLKC